MKKTALLVFACVVLAGCDEKKTDVVDAGAAISPPVVSASAVAAPSAATTPEPAPSASAAPSAAPATKDVTVTVKDPEKEPTKTVKAIAGGTVVLYLPKWAGTTWTATNDKGLGKAKEETIPGFAGPSTPAAGFTWKLDTAKAGQTLKAQLVNKDKAGATKTFALTIEVTAS